MPANSASQPSHAPPTPLKVALAIAIFFPYGFYLLWKHPTLGKKPGWWIAGIAYVLFAISMGSRTGPDASQSSQPKPARWSRHVHPVPSDVLNGLSNIVSKLKKFPDRFTPDSQRDKYNKELEQLIQEVIDMPYDAKPSPQSTRKIIEYYEANIKNRYSGHLLNRLEEWIYRLHSELLDQ